MPDPTELPHIDEELTAYLDGELDAEAARQVEQRLASDTAYRHRLSQLERAWNLLDRLDQATVGESFTRTTLEMVAVAAAEEAQTVQAKLPQRRRLYGLAALASLAGAMLLGYFAMQWFLPRPNERLLADLPLLQRLDMLKSAESLEFLRAMDAKGLFGRAEAMSGTLAAAAWSGESLEQLRTKVAAMSPTQREQLRYDQQEFAGLSAERREKYRQLYRDLTQPENQRLQSVLQQYSEWFDTLSVDRQGELLRLSLAERVRRIQGLKPPLSDDDFRAIVRWTEQFARQRKDALVARWQKDRQKWFGAAPEEEQARILASELVFGRRRFGPEPADPDLETAMVASFAQEVKKLSGPAQSAFAEAKDSDKQREVALAWVNLALREQFNRLIAGSAGSAWLQSQIENFRRSLGSGDAATRLRGLPEEQRAREVRKMFLFEKFRYFDGELPRDRRGQRVPGLFGPPRSDNRPGSGRPPERPPRAAPGDKPSS